MEKHTTNDYGKHLCPCCKYFTLSQPGADTRETCDVCYWENNAAQTADRELVLPPNAVSLNQARRNFRKFGACSDLARASVRPPRPDELP